MNNELIIIIVLAVALIASLVGLLVALFRGEMKKFVVEAMGEAEAKFPKTVENYKLKRLQYVVDAFNKKYKIIEFFLNVRKFIEKVIEYSKTINYNKQ